MQTLDELRTLGEAELGRPLRLELWDMPAVTLGVAWTDLRGTASIALSRHLLQDPDLLRRTFWHEVAHHRAGDCKTPQSDPTRQRLAVPMPPGYTETPRERLAEARATLYSELEQLGMLKTTKPPTAAKKEERIVNTPWTRLIDRTELDALSRTLRNKLDALPVGTTGRESARYNELDAVVGLQNALHTYRTARDSRTPLKAVTDAQKRAVASAKQLASVCAYAGTAMPQRLRDLAAGLGKPAPVPMSPPPAGPARNTSPRQERTPGEWEYAALNHRHRRW